MGWKCLLIFVVVMFWKTNSSTGSSNYTVSEWSSWSECLDVLGNGNKTREQTRQRTCIDNLGQNVTWSTCNCSCSNEENQACVIPDSFNYTISAWSPWSGCVDVHGGTKKTGLLTRYRTCLNESGENVTWSACDCACSNENTKTCYLPVDGGWSDWGDWVCLSNTFHRFRTCSKPKPAHGGKDCDGDSMEQDLAMFVDGEWSSWTNYSRCSVSMGHGFKHRTRACNMPKPCGLLAEPCQGANYTEIECEEFPSCLQGSVFGGNYKTIDDPLVLYSSANIEIYPKTLITCSHVIVSKTWTLYAVDETTNNETMKVNTTDTGFLIPRGEYPQGLYRLYVIMDYYRVSYGFVEGFMYFRLQLPPPNVFIEGGSGRMTNPGITRIDAWSKSYDLTKGPGHRDNMEFLWSCLEFPTNSMDMLMSFIIPESFAFISNVTSSKVSWDFIEKLYEKCENHLNLFPIQNRVFFNDTFVYQHVNLENISSPESCSESSSVITGAVITNENPCVVDKLLSAEAYALLHEMTRDIYIEDILTQKDAVNTFSTDIKNVLPVLKLTENVSSSDINTVENDFLPNMEDLNRFTRNLATALDTLNSLMDRAPKLNNTLRNLQLIDEQLAEVTFIASKFIVLNITDMKFWDSRVHELVFKMLENNNCDSFSVTSPGFAEVFTDPNHPTKAVGYFVTVKTSIFGAENTYQQKIQVIFPTSVSSSVPDIIMECYLNCKPKVATSLVMSLKVKCTSCSASEEENAEYKWDLKKYDPVKKTETTITGWETWLETETSEQKFVAKANSFTGLSYYMLTVRMNVTNESWSEMRMILETTAPPYGGVCSVYSMSDSVVELEMKGWKDEGFRKQKNVELDWKEQISYRIFQEDSRTKEKSLVYQGFERYIKGLYFNYGYEESKWLINIYVEVLDVFGDFKTCHLAPIQMLSPMKDTALDNFLETAQEFIETAIEQSNAGLVSMSLETTISTSNREELPLTGVIDQLVQSPESWSSIGSTVSFDSLFQNLTTSDQNTTTQDLLKEGMQNMTVLLKTSTNSLNLDSTVLQRQMAFCAGSSMEKKQLVTLEAMGTALDATDDVIKYFINTSARALFPVYEDYLSTSEAILRSVDNMLDIFIPKLSPDIPESDDIYQIAEDYTSADAVNGYDGSGFSPQERALFTSMSVAKYNEILNSSLDMANQTVPNVQRSIVELGTVLKQITFRKQFEVEVTRPGLKTSMERVPIDQEVDRKNLKIKFDFQNNNDKEYLQITQYSKTPFIWDSESKNIQSPTVHIVLGNRTSLPTVKTKFRTSASVAKKPVALAFPDDASDYNSQTFNYKILWKNPSDVLVFNFESDLTNVSSYSHVVYAKKDGIPTSLDYEWTKIISQADWVDGGVSCLIPANFCSNPCLMYFAVHVTFIPASHHRRQRRSVYNSTSSVNYIVSGWTTGCRVWDGVKWDKTSCQLSSETNYKETVCECRNPPGDNFATSFFVPPNSIDFSTVFDKFDIIGNGAVFGTVTAIVVLYVIGLLIARRFDRKDREKWKLFYMSDNLKTDKYVYLVTVYTGLSRNSGTKSNISFVIAGQLKDTGIRRLTNGENKGFETGSVCTYVMTAQHCLGDLTYLNIWHDNSGKGGDASWNLVKMVVEDAHTGKRYVFFCNRWLSLDSYDSSIQCTVPVATPESLQTFNVNFNENTRENVTDNHLWLSVIFRPEKSTFSRCERLSCCVTLLFLTMISNAMFYGKGEAVDQIRIGPIKFALSSIYISFIGVLLTFPVILSITMIFKKSKWQDEIQDGDQEYIDTFKSHKKEIKCRLPPRCLYAAYVIVALSILASGFFVILYSMEWGKAKSEEWLKTFFLSLLESLLVVDPIKVLAMAAFVSIIAKQSLDDSVYETTKLLEESQARAIAFARDTNNFTCYGTPYSEQTLENMKRKRLQELRMKRIFVELLLYICFLVVLYFISYNNRDFNSFQMRHHLHSHLLHSPTKNSSFHTLRYDKVRSTEHFYEWLRNTLIPFVFPLTSYNGQTLNAFERQYTRDQANYRLGPVRLRQLRVKQADCYIPLILDAICYADYDIVSEDDRSDCQSWGATCNATNTRWSSKAWQFTSATEIWGVPTMGFLGTYGGGGYIADLGIHKIFANAIVDELFSNKWIDRQTRAIFVEFTQYNSNTNLFTFVSLMTEFPQTGGTFTTAHVYPLRVYQHVGSFGVFIFLCEIVLMVCAIVFFVYFIVQIVKHKNQFFRDNWRIFDLLILVLTIFDISMYLTRMLFTSWTITKFKEQKLKFVNFGHIALWDEVLNAFLSFLVFLSTIRILRVLNYSRNITHLAGVLSNARRNLLGCFFMFALIFLAYAGFGYLLFGSQLETYKNVFVSITTIVNSLVGRNSLHGLTRACPGIAEFYYFTFVMFVIWIVMTMMSATLNRSIREIRNNLERREKMYDIDDLLRDFLKEFWYNINFKLHSISKDPFPLKRTMTSVTSGDVSLVLQELENSSCNGDE